MKQHIRMSHFVRNYDRCQKKRIEPKKLCHKNKMNQLIIWNKVDLKFFSVYQF